MAIRILTLPFDTVTGMFDDGPLTDFLRGKQLHGIDRHFFQQDGRSYWTFFVEYTPVLDDPPLRDRDAEVLNDSERRLMDELRAWRKEAAETLGLPAYVVATNRQLLDLVKMAPASRQALGNIKGFGKKKLQQHSEAILRIIKTFYDESDPRVQQPNTETDPDPAG